jgi:hypothetical protein
VAYTVIIHLQNEDPMVAEMEELPEPHALSFRCINPRRRDGKPLNYIDEQCTSFIFSWNRVSFIEIMSSDEEEEEIVEFFRD